MPPFLRLFKFVAAIIALTAQKNRRIINCVMKLTDKIQGVICIVSSAFFFSLMSLFVRLAGDMPLFQKCFFRNLVALIAITVFMLIKRERFIPKKEARPFILGRAIFGLIGIVLNFAAINNLNIADAAILNKMSPFFAVVLSYVFLKEKITPVDIFALIFAFGGAMLVVKPSFNFKSLYAFGGLIGGISVGAAYTFLRAVGKKGESGSKIVFWFSFISTLVFTPFLIIFYEPIKPMQLLFMCLAGVSAATAQFFVTGAYTKAAAKDISVFDYSQVIFTAVLGLIFLKQYPDVWSVIGYVIIIATAVIKWRLNAKKDKMINSD